MFPWQPWPTGSNLIRVLDFFCYKYGVCSCKSISLFSTICLRNWKTYMKISFQAVKFSMYLSWGQRILNNLWIILLLSCKVRLLQLHLAAYGVFQSCYWQVVKSLSSFSLRITFLLILRWLRWLTSLILLRGEVLNHTDEISENVAEEFLLWSILLFWQWHPNDQILINVGLCIWTDCRVDVVYSGVKEPGRAPHRLVWCFMYKMLSV